MRPIRLLFPVLSVLALATSVRADDPAKVDYKERNSIFAPGATVAPEINAPQPNTSVQTKRVEPTVIDKKDAAVGARRAAIDVNEARDKNVVPKKSTSPEAKAPQMNDYNHREARYQPTDNTEKPELVSRYQDSLVAASATNMGRFPALDGGTKARINRFVFRKNAPEKNLPAEAPVTSVANGTTVNAPK